MLIKQRQDRSPAVESLAGGLAGGTVMHVFLLLTITVYVTSGVSRLFVAPLDLLKIRVQIDNKDSIGRNRYPSLTAAITDVYAEEGLIGFWRYCLKHKLFTFLSMVFYPLTWWTCRGNLAATFLWIAYGAVQVGWLIKCMCYFC
jgi:hypothetical protein